MPLPPEDQNVTNLFSLLSARSDLLFIEGFNLDEIVEMIEIYQQARLCIKFENCVNILFNCNLNLHWDNF